MHSQLWRSINDITALFTAKPIAVPLTLLLLAKIYWISPDTLVYVLGLLLLSTLVTARWGIHYLATRRIEFIEEYERQKSSDNPPAG